MQLSLLKLSLYANKTTYLMTATRLYIVSNAKYKLFEAPKTVWRKYIRREASGLKEMAAECSAQHFNDSMNKYDDVGGHLWEPQYSDSSKSVSSGTSFYIYSLTIIKRFRSWRCKWMCKNGHWYI